MAYDLGGFDDEVRLKLAGDDVLVAESWDVHEAVLAQPSAWSIRLGSSAIAGDFLAKYKKGDPFELYIGGALQMSGKIDGVGASGTATQVIVKGRDALAPAHDSGILKVRSFKDDTYSSIVKWALNEVGLDPSKLKNSNSANRKLKAGIPITELAAPVASDLVLQEEVGKPNGSSGDTVGSIVHEEHQNAINESALTFIRRHIDRAGLFLWATADGHFVLSIPNGHQKPAYRLIRRKDGRNEGANVELADFMDDATHRHATAVCYSRTGGKKNGRAKVKGAYVDEELSNLGYKTCVVFRDANVQNTAQAEFFCRRKLAEERRNGFTLSYKVGGHTLPALGGGRGVITVDTTIEVVDEVLGIADVFYIESLQRQRERGTWTTLRLMRTGDLIFGGDA